MSNWRPWSDELGDGHSPVSGDRFVEIKRRDGTFLFGTANSFNWSWLHDYSNVAVDDYTDEQTEIVEYRLKDKKE